MVPVLKIFANFRISVSSIEPSVKGLERLKNRKLWQASSTCASLPIWNIWLVLKFRAAFLSLKKSQEKTRNLSGDWKVMSQYEREATSETTLALWRYNNIEKPVLIPSVLWIRIHRDPKFLSDLDLELEGPDWDL
jgi:hypothetical protein